MIGLMCPKELMLTKLIVRVSVLFVITGTFIHKFKFEPDICNGCHYLIQKVISFNGFDIVSVKGNDNTIHFLFMSKNEGHTFLKKCSFD